MTEKCENAQCFLVLNNEIYNYMLDSSIILQKLNHLYMIFRTPPPFFFLF